MARTKADKLEELLRDEPDYNNPSSDLARARAHYEALQAAAVQNERPRHDEQQQRVTISQEQVQQKQVATDLPAKPTTFRARFTHGGGDHGI